MSSLNVLYCCDDNYAPYANVSIYSLLKNNKNFDIVNIYVILDNVSENNKLMMMKQIELYQANFIPIDAEEIVKEIVELGLPRYRNSYATYFRLFLEHIIDSKVEKLLYLDCDTIVCGSLLSIMESDMGEFCMYVVQESLADRYKDIIGMSYDEPYFNAGVLLINLKNWWKYDCKTKIIQHIKKAGNKYCCHDQDLLNIVLKDYVCFISPRYNLQPIHRLLNARDYKTIYNIKSYYSEKEIEFARSNPVILHTYRFLGEFPWHKNSRHPDTGIFDDYLKESTQSNYIKKRQQVGIMIKVEKILYLLLPRKWFFKLFKMVHEWSFRRQSQLIAKEMGKDH